uniref:Uncharacterized protein n=1 Tax=Aegilops tauschii TaxID=37682 RepID=R7W3P5_AEGTA
MVLRIAEEAQHFQVDKDDEQHTRALVCVYSSKTGLWGDLISTLLPYHAHRSSYSTLLYEPDAVLAGDSLYWMLSGNVDGILEFDLEKQSLAVI